MSVVWGGLRYNENVIAVGAQTERRGDAGPVRGLLGGKDLTGRFFLRQPFQADPSSILYVPHGTACVSLERLTYLSSSKSLRKSSRVRSGSRLGSFFNHSTFLKPFAIACRRSANDLSG